MNQIPLYIVTSFLSTGKTAFINRMTKHNDRVAVIAFEEGMQELTKPHISVSYNGDGGPHGPRFLAIPVRHV